MKLSKEQADRYARQIILSEIGEEGQKKLINAKVLVIESKPFVHAAVFQFFGQAMTIIPGASACYRCLLPESPPTEVIPEPEKSGIIGTVAGLLGIIQANEIIKYILDAGELLTGKLLMFDALDCSFEKIDIKKDPDCAVCSN